MQPVLPPYRVEIRPQGIGPSPPTFPVKVQRTTPGVTGEICTPDEVAMWAYVEHLEAKVRELSEPTITVRELNEAEQAELQTVINKAVAKYGDQPVLVLPTGAGEVAPAMGPPKKRKGKQ